jgi:hypothetical protein
LAVRRRRVRGGGLKLGTYDIELPALSSRRASESDQCSVVLVMQTPGEGLTGDICRDDLFVRDVSALELQCSYTNTESMLARRVLLLCSIVEYVLKTYPAGSVLQLGAGTSIIRDECQATGTCTKEFAALGMALRPRA